MYSIFHMSRHKFLKFKSIPWMKKNFFNSWLSNVEKRNILIPKSLDWAILASIGVYHDTNLHLTKSMMAEEYDMSMISLAWNNIFNIKEVHNLWRTSTRLLCYNCLQIWSHKLQWKRSNHFPTWRKSRECSILVLPWRYGIITREEDLTKDYIYYISQ